MYKDVSKDRRFLELKRILGELQREYSIPKEDILDACEDVKIPVSLFASGLSSLEIISKYLIENKARSVTSAAELCGRSKQGIWQAYREANKKFSGKFRPAISKHDFPAAIIKDRRYSVLESIVKFLREHHSLAYTRIAGLLNRDQRTVWTAYNRTKSK
ncbi:hypothetical protein GF323_00790 [Candidatus Woesearchaeota archaeon]|nr:hypothetical protein [Candidatus Woesearchaeota archaeon]